MICCIQKGNILKELKDIVNDLVTKVFNKHTKLDINTISIDGFDLDRIYINNSEYILRMWNVSEDGNVEYTLYKTIKNSALNIGSGKTSASKRFVRLLQEDAEQKYLEYTKNNNKEK